MKIYWNGERKNVIGSRVKELRKKQDISQKILAARLSLSGIDFTELTILRIVDITVRQSRQSGVARATCPD